MLEQPVDRGEGGIGFAGTGGHLDRRPGAAGLEGFFEVGDGGFLAIAQAQFFLPGDGQGLAVVPAEDARAG